MYSSCRVQASKNVHEHVMEGAPFGGCFPFMTNRYMSETSVLDRASSLLAIFRSSRG